MHSSPPSLGFLTRRKGTPVFPVPSVTRKWFSNIFLTRNLTKFLRLDRYFRHHVPVSATLSLRPSSSGLCTATSARAPAPPGLQLCPPAGHDGTTPSCPANGLPTAGTATTTDSVCPSPPTRHADGTVSHASPMTASSDYGRQQDTWQTAGNWGGNTSWSNPLPDMEPWNRSRDFRPPPPSPYQTGAPTDRRPNQRQNGGYGPFRGGPRSQSAGFRGQGPRAPRPYDRPPAQIPSSQPSGRNNPKNMKQQQMPLYTTVEGKPTELCIFAAREEACKRKDCPYGHDPKLRRICRAFHTKGDFCQEGENCLLGHYEARAALEEQKRFKKVIYANHTEAYSGNNQDGGEGATAGGATGTGGNNNPAAFNNPQNPNPHIPQVNQPPQAFQPPTQTQATLNPVPTNPIPRTAGAPGQLVPPSSFHFQELTLRNNAAGQQDEIARLKLR
jgi:hypothetical protein